MGGVKRPAEGYREEPSEKKNLPVVAKTFVAKTAENRPPSVHLAAQTYNKVTALQVMAGWTSHFVQEMNWECGTISCVNKIRKKEVFF